MMPVMQTYSTALFSFNRETRVFASEASTLEFRQIPETIALQSERSGQTIDFELREVIHHGYGEDREIGGWEFRPKFPHLLAHDAALSKLVVRVFNT